jgi:hypothetical protein
MIKWRLVAAEVRAADSSEASVRSEISGEFYAFGDPFEIRSNLQTF